MKTNTIRQSSSPNVRAASKNFVLGGLMAASAFFALPVSSHAQISAFAFTLDGNFSFGGEWSDITPNAFISSPNAPAIPTTIANPLKNTLLYAAISHNVASPAGDLQLHLMYDFLPRTQAPQANEVFATVTFPVTRQDTQGNDLPKDNISVIFVGNGLPSFFDIFVDLDINNPSPLSPISVIPGLKGAASAAGSSLSAIPHLLVELEVGLRIPAGFGDNRPNGLPGGGINPATGLYDPDPVFWGAAGSGNGSPAGSPDGGQGAGGPLQSATSALIEINHDGSLTVTPILVPEPASAALLVAGLGAFAARRRRQAV